MSLSCVLEEGLSMWRSWEEGRGEDGLREKSGQRVKHVEELGGGKGRKMD